MLAALGNVGIGLWRAQPTLETVAALHAMSSALVRDHGCTSTIFVAIDNVPPPSPEARARLLDYTRELDNHFIAVANVLEGTGFWASAMRSFITGVQWAARRTAYERHVFESVVPASQWLAPLHSARSTAITPEELQRACLAVRQHTLAQAQRS